MTINLVQFTPLLSFLGGGIDRLCGLDIAPVLRTYCRDQWHNRGCALSGYPRSWLASGFSDRHYRLASFIWPRSSASCDRGFCLLACPDDRRVAGWDRNPLRFGVYQWPWGLRSVAFILPFSGSYVDVYGGCFYHRLADGIVDLVKLARTVNRSRGHI